MVSRFPRIGWKSVRLEAIDVDREDEHTWNWCSVGREGCLNKTRSRNGKICRPCMDAKTRDKCPEYYKLKASLHYLKNRQYILDKQSKYRQENKEEVSFKSACYRDQHREELNEYAKQYRKRNRVV
jgi:hypothetical protein